MNEKPYSQDENESEDDPSPLPLEVITPENVDVQLSAIVGLYSNSFPFVDVKIDQGDREGQFPGTIVTLLGVKAGLLFASGVAESTVRNNAGKVGGPHMSIYIGGEEFGRGTRLVASDANRFQTWNSDAIVEANCFIPVRGGVYVLHFVPGLDFTKRSGGRKKFRGTLRYKGSYTLFQLT